MDSDLSKFLGKDVRIKQADGFVKVGRLTAVTSDSIDIQFRDGRITSISRDYLVEIREAAWRWDDGSHI